MKFSVQFGIGAVFAKGTGGNLATPNPVIRLLSVQDGEVEFDQKVERLMGQLKLPDDIAASDTTIKGKFSAGRIGIDVYNALMLGETITSGSTQVVTDEADTVPAPSGPYTIQVANYSNFLEDLGVLYAATNQPLQLVASLPTQGQYSVNTTTGVYTFAAADASTAVKISYSYNATGVGRTLTMTSRPQGYGPALEIFFTMPYTSTPFPTSFGSIRLRACKITKMGLPQKRAGYLITPVEFEAFPDASGSAVDFYSNS